ncbi:MAG: hypothetical protein SFU21_03775 [Flavihumibacter sp.]|nr:hypothetical protein [Flavihumibacter sp.]
MKSKSLLIVQIVMVLVIALSIYFIGASYFSFKTLQQNNTSANLISNKSIVVMLLKQSVLPALFLISFLLLLKRKNWGWVLAVASFIALFIETFAVLLANREPAALFFSVPFLLISFLCLFLLFQQALRKLFNVVNATYLLTVASIVVILILLNG